MKPESQRIAIAKACGWTIHGSAMRIFGNPDDKFGSVSACHGLYGFPRSGKDDWIPDYVNDLNAMHEARQSLPKDKITEYHSILHDICGGISNAIDATAAQRAEAFLRTLSLWKE